MPFIETNRALLAFVLVVLFSLAAAMCDVRTRRIPNALVLGLFFAGLLLNAAAGPAMAALDFAITVAVLVLGTLAFSLRLIGGGDIKLLAAAAGTLNFPAAIVFFLLTFLAGGVLGVVYAFARGRLAETIANVQGAALPLLAGTRPAAIRGGTQMPYALAICAGSLLTLLCNGALPHLRF